MDNNERTYAAVDRLRSPERLARMEVDRVVELCLADGDIRSVLDAGCGSGVFAEAFASRGIETAGLDGSPAMIDAARKYVPGAEFRIGSVEAIPWPDDAFDLVFLGLVLHEADHPLTALRESRRVARIRVAALEWPYRAQDFGPPLAHRLRPGDVTDLALDAGFGRFDLSPLKHLVLYRMSSQNELR